MLEDQLRNAKLEKSKLQQELRDIGALDIKNKVKLKQYADADEFQKQIKYLVEDLRVWRNKNLKLETQIQKNAEVKNKQQVKM